MAVVMPSVKDRLLDLLVSGEYRGGQWLRESNLATALGVSRTPIRDALRELATVGVVDLVPHRGARIRHYSISDVEEVYRARAVVEPAAVASAVPQLRRQDIERLNDLNAQMAALPVDDGPPAEAAARGELSRLNNAFHQVFLDAAANRPLAAAAMHLRTPLLVAKVFVSYSPTALERSIMHHQELAIAASVQDADWAAAIMRAHILAGLQGHRDSAAAESP